MSQKKNAPNAPEETADAPQALSAKHATQREIGEERKMSKRRAVIVGINDYQGTWNDLPSCVKDAESFRDLLNHKLGFTEIKVLTDKQATRSNVTNSLDWLFENATAQDRLVFFYSGHGTTKPDGNVMQEYLCLYDDILQDDELARRTQDLPDGIFTAVLDCCFSGGMEKRRYEAVVHGFSEASTSLNGPSLSIERSQVKTFVSDPQQLRIQEDAEEKATFYRPFGQVARLTPSGFRRSVPMPARETTDLVMRGTLIGASLETETAAAGTSQTNGLSAFTYALLKVFEGRSVAMPIYELVQHITMELRMLGLRQTPMLKARPSSLIDRSFLNLELVASIPGYSERRVDQRSVESLVNTAINNLFGFGSHTRLNPWITPTSPWRENMYANVEKTNIANLVANVMPAVVENVQREQMRRAQFHGLAQPFTGWGQQPMPFAPQFGTLPQLTTPNFPHISPWGIQPQALVSHQFAQTLPFYGMQPTQNLGFGRPVHFCALECTQRISAHVLQTLPYEYRQLVQPALTTVLPLIVESVSREWSRLAPIVGQFSQQIRERQYIETIIHAVVVSVVDSIIREHQVRFGYGPQYGVGYGASHQTGFGFAGMVPQHEQIVLTQTISAIVPTIVELIERERVRLTQLGQAFSPEVIPQVTQQVIAQVQPMIASPAVLTILPTIVESICRQLTGQTPYAHQYLNPTVAQPTPINVPVMA